MGLGQAHCSCSWHFLYICIKINARHVCCVLYRTFYGIIFSSWISIFFSCCFCCLNFSHEFGLVPFPSPHSRYALWKILHYTERSHQIDIRIYFCNNVGSVLVPSTWFKDGVVSEECQYFIHRNKVLSINFHVMEWWMMIHFHTRHGWSIVISYRHRHFENVLVAKHGVNYYRCHTTNANKLNKIRSMTFHIIPFISSPIGEVRDSFVHSFGFNWHSCRTIMNHRDVTLKLSVAHESKCADCGRIHVAQRWI